jgi:hypothetical protein
MTSEVSPQGRYAVQILRTWEILVDDGLLICLLGNMLSYFRGCEERISTRSGG